MTGVIEQNYGSDQNGNEPKRPNISNQEKVKALIQGALDEMHDKPDAIAEMEEITRACGQ